MFVRIECFFCARPLLSTVAAKDAEEAYNTRVHQCPESAIHGIKLRIELRGTSRITPKANDK